MDGSEKTAELFDGSAGGISEAIEKLRQHPEIISAVASALSGSFSQAGENASETGDTSGEKGSPSPVGGISPEKLSEVMAAVGPMISSLGGNHQKDSKKSPAGNREALLCALRPYVSRERREMIDRLMGFIKIGDLLKKTK